MNNGTKSERATSRFSRIANRIKSERGRIRAKRGTQPSKYRHESDRPSLCAKCSKSPTDPKSRLNFCTGCKADYRRAWKIDWLEKTGRTLGGRKHGSNQK